MTGRTLASEYHLQAERFDEKNSICIANASDGFCCKLFQRALIFFPTLGYFLPHEGLKYLLWIVPYLGIACSLPRNWVFPTRELYSVALTIRSYVRLVLYYHRALAP